MSANFVPAPWAGWIVGIALGWSILLGNSAAQELPKADDKPQFDLEPKLMLNDVPGADLPTPLPDALNSGATSADVAKLTADLDRARKNAALRDRLCKAGVLSKLEAEQGALKVVRLTRDLAEAKRRVAAQAVEDQKKDDAKPSPEAEKTLAEADSAAKEAADQWSQAQRAAAELRVQRERKLFSLGAGSKISVKRAEAALQSLTLPAITAPPLPTPATEKVAR